MAIKKIRLDFSKTEERSGYNTRAIPEGLHKMKVEAVHETEAQDGTAMLVYDLVPVDPKYKSRRFPFYCKLQQNQLWKLRDLLVATGSTVPKKALSIDPNTPVGKLLAAEVEDESNAQYAGRSTIQGTYSLDILDEDGSAPDDDEDEYDDEEEADGEEIEDYEDDESEDLEALSLVELRKMAKGLGIDTTGLKKPELIEAIEEEQQAGDEEDDDLDDEDLEDEELEDEEFDDDDEPVVTKRRAPAAKAPAKAAAPVKRTIKRR